MGFTSFIIKVDNLIKYDHGTSCRLVDKTANSNMRNIIQVCRDNDLLVVNKLCTIPDTFPSTFTTEEMDIWNWLMFDIHTLYSLCQKYLSDSRYYPPFWSCPCVYWSVSPRPQWKFWCYSKTFCWSDWYACAVQSQLVPTSASSTDLPSDSNTPTSMAMYTVMHCNDAKALWQAIDWKGGF